MTDEVIEEVVVDDSAEAQPVPEGTPPAPEPTDDAAGSDTLMGNAGDDKTEITPQADWPSDWREKFAGEDEALLKQMGRYNSVPDALKAGAKAQRKLREGAHKNPEKPTEDASDEERSAYRESLGVPESAKDYNLDLENGLVIGENDQPYVDMMLEKFHSMDMPDADVNKMMNAYFEMEQQGIEAQQDRDHQVQADTVDALREEYGPEFRQNSTKTLAFMEQQFGEEGAFMLMNARTGENGEGPRLGDVLEFNQQILSMANKINPSITVVPNSSNPSQTIKDELAELKGQVGTDEWYSDIGKQERYQALLKAEQDYA